MNMQNSEIIVLNQSIYPFPRIPVPAMAMRVIHYENECIRPHYHDFYELAVVQSGQGFHCLDGVNQKIVPGAVFFIVPGQVHKYSGFTHLNILTFLFSGEAFQFFQQKYGGLPGFRMLMKEHLFSLNDMIMAKLGVLVDQITDECQKKEPGFLLAMELALGESLLLLARNLKAVSRISNRMLSLSNVLVYIEEHLQEELSLEKMAEIARMSVTSFRRAFKQETNFSPIQFILQKRIEKACEFLAVSDKSLSEIASETGFLDANYFSRQFQRIMGITPGCYRKMDHGWVHTPGLDKPVEDENQHNFSFHRFC